MKKIAMSRPRILVSSRTKKQNLGKIEVEKKVPEIVTIVEPECEVIKIDTDDEEKESSMKIQVHGVAEMQYKFSQYLPSMLSFEFVPPNPLRKKFENSDDQRVCMILPVGNQQSTIVNENSEIRQTVEMQQKTRIKKETDIILIDEIDDNPRNIENLTLQEINSSFVENEANVSIKMTESFDNSLANHKSRSKEPENKIFGNKKNRSEIVEFSGNFRFVEDPKEAIFSTKNSNNTNNNSSTISSKNSTILLSNNPKDDENITIKHGNFSSPIASCSKVVEDDNSFGVKNNEIKSSSKGECIVCKIKFVDRRELHKHLILEHSNVQILFCDLCKDSFFTQEELKLHHNKYCNPNVTEIVETIVIEVEDDSSRAKEEKSEKKAIYRRLRDKKLPIRRAAQNIIIKRKRGRPARIFSKSRNIEEKVLNHVTVDKTENFEEAEIKRLVVELPRLEGPELEIYLEKRQEKPVVGFRDEKKPIAKKKRRRRAKNNYNNVGNHRKQQKLRKELMEYRKIRNSQYGIKGKEEENTIFRRDSKIITRNSAKLAIDKDYSACKEIANKNVDKTLDFRMKEPIFYNQSNDNSNTEVKIVGVNCVNVNRDIAVDDDRLGTKELPIIRKLTSKSSADSVFSLTKTQKNRAQCEKGESSKDWNLGRKNSVILYKSIEKTFRYTELEKTQGDSLDDDTMLAEFDPEEFEEVAEDNEEDNVGNAKNRQRNEADLRQEKAVNSRKSVLQKTYLPSKSNASKLVTKFKETFNVTSRNLCLMCKKLLVLMKKLSGQLDGNKAKKMSVKCPLCSLYFISMFYLGKHISTYHLHCQSKVPCNLAQSLMLSRSFDESTINCETQVELAIECQHCSVKFSEEKDLVDHVFTQHDTPISNEEYDNDLPYYIKDLSNSYFQTFDCVNYVESSSKRRKLDDNRPNVTLPIFQTSRSTEITNNFRETEHLLPRNQTESFVSEKTFVTTEIDGKDENTADREYLLKQLLSDDSEDSSQVVEKEFPTKDSVEPEKEFSSSKCHICRKEFKRTKDLVIHSIEHDSNVSESISNDRSTEINDLCADWLDYNWNASHAAETTIKTKFSKTTDENLQIKDNIFASGDEDNDFFLVYENNERKMCDSIEKYYFLDTELSSKCEKTKNQNLGKFNEDSSKIAVKNTEAKVKQHKKHQILQELLETEEGLGNSEETNEKLPIECNKCNRKFPNRASLNEHLFFLHDDNLKDTVLTDVISPISRLDNEKQSQQWRCDKCSHNFKLLQSYGRHRYFVHGDDEMVHVCENCCKVLTTVTMVNVHICTDVASYNCRTCQETFATGMMLRLHNMYKHKETDGPHLCLPCNKKFLTNAMLKRHEKWKHRFLRPYRPRRSSPVLMATPNNVSDNEGTGGKITSVRKRVSTSRKISTKKKHGKSSTQEKNPPKVKHECCEKNLSNANRIVTFIDEREIFQCNLCRIYCLSIETLKSHKSKSHEKMSEFCRVCEKMYPKGKLIRHIMDEHIYPCENYTETRESMWNIGTNVEEKDAEELIRMLGMNRFISLCEYQRFSESTEDGISACPNCGDNLDNSEDYKHHFLMNHDTMCALCNIEFKSGDKAAIHKIEDHGSIDSYIWFADQTVTALTAATNFSEAAEKSFIEMISRESDNTSNESNDEKCSNEYFEKKKTNRDSMLPVDFAERDNQKLIIVVTEGDLQKYGIRTENPNIWGLASKISSTSGDHTPMDIKEILDGYFGK